MLKLFRNFPILCSLKEYLECRKGQPRLWRRNLYRHLFQAQFKALSGLSEDGRVCRKPLETPPPEKVLGNQALLQSVITAPRVVGKEGRTAGS